MAESESQPILPTADNGDVERLLREAEALTQEVAHATGAPTRDADALLSGELTEPPDPLAAVEAASANVMSLEDLLGELGPSTPADEMRNQPSDAHRAASAPPARSARQPSNPNTPREKSNRVDVAPARPGPRVEHMPTAEAEAASESGAAAPGDSADMNASGVATDGKNPLQPAKPKNPRVPIARRMLNGVKASARGVKWTLLLILRDLPMGLLTWFDLPFRRMPRTIKNAIGIIGAITLGMGALAWAMPDLMKPHPKPAAAEGEAEGREAPEHAAPAHESGHKAGH